MNRKPMKESPYAGGDSARKMLPYKKLPQTPSSRKFTVNRQLVFDDDDGADVDKTSNILSHLEQCLTPNKQKPKTPQRYNSLKKAKSVAELTPTKLNKILSDSNNNLAIRALHETPSNDRRASPLVLTNMAYRRLLLRAWRRCRERFATLSESSRRQQDQIGHLVMVVDCLKNLNKSENNKRHKMFLDYQKLEGQFEQIEKDKNNLIEENEDLKANMISLKQNNDGLTNQIENIKNNVNTQNEINKGLEMKLGNFKMIYANKVKENEQLEDTVTRQEIVIKNQIIKITDLEIALKYSQEQSEELQKTIESQSRDYEDVKLNLDEKTKIIIHLKDLVNGLKDTKDNLEKKIVDLEDQVFSFTQEIDNISYQNNTLRTVIFKMNEKPKWWRNTKKMGSFAYKMVEHCAYLLLPSLSF